MMIWKYRNKGLGLISLYFVFCQSILSCASTEPDIQSTDTSYPGVADAIKYWNKGVPDKCPKDKGWLKHQYLNVESWYLLGKLYGMKETVIYVGTNNRKGIDYINHALYAAFPKLRLSSYNFITPDKLYKDLKIAGYKMNSEFLNKKTVLYNSSFKNLIMQGSHININARGVSMKRLSNKHNVEFYFVSGTELQKRGVCFWKTR